MQYWRNNKKTLIAGGSSTGKTTYYLKQIEREIGNYNHVLVFDFEGEISERTGQRPCLTLPEIRKGMTRPGLMLFDPIRLFGAGKRVAAFNWFTGLLWTILEKLERAKIDETWLFCCDEIQNFIPIGNMTQTMRNIIETGRRYGVDMLTISNRPNAVHNGYRNNLTDIVCFRLMDENAKKFLQDAGLTFNGVERLQVGEYIHFHLDKSGQITRGDMFKKK